MSKTIPVNYYSIKSATRAAGLRKAVCTLPFLNELFEDMATEATSWNGMTDGILSSRMKHCVKIEISPVVDYGDCMEAVSFEDSILNPEETAAYSLYTRIKESDGNYYAELLHDADSLAEAEFRALLAIHCISNMKMRRAA
ncbi:hypothetical protein [Serratia ficaria]|uniref:hypothetical protein n=1 Tax=Serratia ficaria TaxID=61651 RepID=UPI002182E524|nr:hypothetical protein [Serratia ficaria]CAI2537537.1 Uncharacterised protein [Serratia ficaria]